MNVRSQIKALALLAPLPSTVRNFHKLIALLRAAAVLKECFIRPNQHVSLEFLPTSVGSVRIDRRGTDAPFDSDDTFSFWRLY